MNSDQCKAIRKLNFLDILPFAIMSVNRLNKFNYPKGNEIYFTDSKMNFKFQETLRALKE